MGLRRALALLPLLSALGACATLGAPERSERIPFDGSWRDLDVSAAAVDGVIEIAVTSRSAEPIRVRVVVPRTAIGRRAETERQVVGYREEVVCVGDSCRLVKVPVYREETVVRAVLAVARVAPRSFRLEPGKRAAFTVSLANAGDATGPFDLPVRLVVEAKAWRARLELRCDAAFLAKGP
jgi:hypothetical protein